MEFSKKLFAITFPTKEHFEIAARFVASTGQDSVSRILSNSLAPIAFISRFYATNGWYWDPLQGFWAQVKMVDLRKIALSMTLDFLKQVDDFVDNAESAELYESFCLNDRFFDDTWRETKDDLIRPGFESKIKTEQRKNFRRSRAEEKAALKSAAEKKTPKSETEKKSDAEKKPCKKDGASPCQFELNRNIECEKLRKQLMALESAVCEDCSVPWKLIVDRIMAQY